MSPIESRATFRLSFDCNNACVFCAQLDRSESFELSRAQLEQLRADHDALTFIGGEPTLDARLLEAVELAHELGFSDIGIQTNAQFMAEDPQLLARLAAAGLSDIHLSIHSPDAAAHDYQSGRPGSYEHCMQALRSATRLGLTAVVTTVVTRSNFRELLRMPPLLKRQGAAGWLIEFVRPYGRAADGFARVVPRFGMALPRVLHALELARRHALSAWIRGAPLCGLGPFASLGLPAAPRAYVEACERCPSRPGCAGVDSSYLEVFDASELRAVQVRPPATFDAGRQHLIKMFVGIGELVEGPPRLYSPGAKSSEEPSEPEPGGKHRRLPVLANDPPPASDSNPVES